MSAVASRYIAKVVEAVLLTQAHRATKYLDPKNVVRATRRLQKGRVPKSGNVEVTLTIGRPNYAERQFIADCRCAGERFPVKNILLTYPPKRAA